MINGIKTSIMGVLGILLFSHCEKDIEVFLPPHESQLVVECYLQRGQLPRLVLTESVSYFDEPKFPQVKNAEAEISTDDRVVPLKYNLQQDQATGKIFNFSANETLRLESNKTYTLHIRDTLGRELTGETRLLPSVTIKSFEVKFNRFEEASITLRFDDNVEEKNYYRLQIMRDSLGVLVPEFDYEFNDSFEEDQEIVLGTGFDFEKGDIVVANLYHIEKQYYDFLRSAKEAISSNGNPFGQPSRIRSSVRGGLGIFTILVYDSKRIEIK